MVGSAEEVWEGGLGYHGQLKIQRDMSAAGRFPLRSVGSKSQAGFPILQDQSWKGIQITSSCVKKQGFCLLGGDCWKHRHPLKGPMHTIFFAATYPGLLQRESKVELETLEERLGFVGLRRELKEQLLCSLC